jgi:electron transport complex protein RnfC
VKSIIERIDRGQFWKFHGGIHPPEQKTLTNEKPIRSIELPEELVLPLQQHIGQAGTLLVKEGDYVLKGQQLTKCSSPMAVPIHAPTSGTINAIKPAVLAHPSGLTGPCLFMTPDGEDKWQTRTPCEDFYGLSREVIVNKIANAGIAGMGGAGFPTHIKVNTKPVINFLIINAAECEPYITADDLLIREHSTSIVDGIKILDHLLLPEFILIGIEDNKPEAIKALQQATKKWDKVRVCVLPTKYPTGGEKQLIKALTGKEVQSGMLPINLGIVMQNVATCFAIADAVINDSPLIKRVVTVTGQSLDKPQNIWSLLGTPTQYLLDQCGYHYDNAQNAQHLIMGGPMMGFSLSNNDIPVIKTTNCILAPSEVEIPSTNNEVDCIRCGQCAEVCPSQLLPQELQWSAKAKDQDQLKKLNLFDCIDCGACAYVCPSQIPLVQYYRVAKAEIRQQQLLDLKAEKAKVRFESRKARLEQEKRAREEKHKKAAEARKAAMNKKTAEGGSATSAVAAALARVKAKKAQANGTEQEAKVKPSVTSPEKSQVAAAIARAKAKKLAKEKPEPAVETTADEEKAQKNNLPDKTQVDKAQADKKQQQKAKVAVAVAKAKAKKAAQKKEQEQINQQKTPDNAPIDDQKIKVDDKKAKIAAAVAKAKAKKLAAKEKQSSQNVESR